MVGRAYLRGGCLPVQWQWIQVIVLVCTALSATGVQDLDGEAVKQTSIRFPRLDGQLKQGFADVSTGEGLVEESTREVAQSTVTEEENGAAREPFSLLWVTDVHLDPLYSSQANEKTRCRKYKTGRRLVHKVLIPKTEFLPSKSPPTQRVNVLNEVAVRAEEVQDPKAEEREHRHLKSSNSGGVSPFPEFGFKPHFHPEETDASLGRAGCDAPRALVAHTLSFVANFVGRSRGQQVPAEDAEGPSESPAKQAADKAFEASPVHPVVALLLTGDFAAHFKDAEVEERKESLVAWTRVLYKHFPQTPCKASEPSLSPLQLLLVVGNNDFPVDGIVPPARSEWSQFLWGLWKDALPKDAETEETFLRGMYYSTLLKEVPSVRVLCLNTVFYSFNARVILQDKLAKGALPSAQRFQDSKDKSKDSLVDLSSEGTLNDSWQGLYVLPDDQDPAGQFSWMEKQLEDARAKGEQVIIAGHIPPGFHSMFVSLLEGEILWLQKYVDRYREISLRYSDVIVSHHYAHVHQNIFKAISNPEDALPGLSPQREVGCPERVPGSPGVLVVAPSVSPILANNPALATLSFEFLQRPSTSAREGGQEQLVLQNYVQYKLPLYGVVPERPPSPTPFLRRPQFEFEYHFLQTYGPFFGFFDQGQPQARGGGLLSAGAKQQEFADANASSPANSQQCIDGGTALALSRVLSRSPEAYLAFQTHLKAGGALVPSPLTACDVVSLTPYERAACLGRISVRPVYTHRVNTDLTLGASHAVAVG